MANPKLLGIGLPDAEPLERCCCMWERPGREEKDRRRRLVNASADCKGHAKAARDALKGKR